MYTENLQMSKWRQAIFPVENRELRKFVPFALLIFITVFNFTSLRNAKDTLILTAEGSGAEVISYLKMVVVMPVVLAFGSVYLQLRKKYGFEKTYEYIIKGFLIFFVIFNFFLYPNASSLHMSSETLASWKLAYPRIQFFFPVIGVWTYSLYYLVAEMWGTFCLSVLFWQFANENIGIHEAKRFYPQFLFVNAVATTLVGIVMLYSPSVSSTNTIVVLTGVVMLVVLRHLQKNILSDPKYRKDVVNTSKKKKVKLSFFESMRELMSSPYIALLSVLILAYGLSINMMEVCWKSVAKQYYPLQEDYMTMTAYYSIFTGATGMVMVIVSKGMLRRFGWLATAIVTPIIISIMSAGYFSFVLFPNLSSSWMLAAGFTNPLAFSVMFGMFGVIFSKSAKYSFFDPTKELAYIPLDPDLRATGKAAADGVGGRLGKAGSSGLQMLLFFITGGSLKDIMPFLAILIQILIVVWIFAAIRLSVLYNKALDDAGIED
jgi:AAA family ATP:ADP antiporter